MKRSVAVRSAAESDVPPRAARRTQMTARSQRACFGARAPAREPEAMAASIHTAGARNRYRAQRNALLHPGSDSALRVPDGLALDNRARPARRLTTAYTRRRCLQGRSSQPRSAGPASNAYVMAIGSPFHSISGGAGPLCGTVHVSRRAKDRSCQSPARSDQYRLPKCCPAIRVRRDSSSPACRHPVRRAC